MKRLAAAFVAAALVATLATGVAPAAAAPATQLKLSGTLKPAPVEGGGNYAYIISDQAINAQDGADLIISGKIGELPPVNKFWVEIGLVSKGLRDKLLAGDLASLWDEGVYLLTTRTGSAEAGVYALSCEDFALQDGTPTRKPVANDGELGFQLALRPTITKAGGKGGTATLRAEGLPTNQGSRTLAYGKHAETDEKPTEDYSAAYLVAQVYSDKNLRGVPVNVTAKLLPAAVRVTDVRSFNPTMSPDASFSPGQAVIFNIFYSVFSTDKGRLYDVRGTVEMFDQSQGFIVSTAPGSNDTMRAFMVPFKTKAGSYNAKVTLQLASGGQVVYTDTYTKKITVK